jgi:hypothetical protein
LPCAFHQPQPIFAWQQHAHLLDDLHLAVEARRSALDQRHVGCQAHLVHMTARFQVIERIEHDIELAEPCHVEPRIFDVIVIRLDLDRGVESARRLLRDLRTCQPWRDEFALCIGHRVPMPLTS